MVGKKGKREKVETLLLVVPIEKNKDYPRLEVHLDRTGATVGLKETDDPKIPLSHLTYTGTTPAHIMRLVDNAMLTEKMTKYRRRDYEPTLKGFYELVREHNEFMENLWKENKI